MPCVVFRVDASLQIGTGHVMRCLTLADALSDQGADILFICREHPGNLIDFIKKRGFEVKGLPVASGKKNIAWLGDSPERDAALTIDLLQGIRPDWLVVDHYRLDAGWEAKLRPYVDRLMVIDDLADRRHDCDLLLDQNFCLGDDRRYADLVAPSCRQLLGPKYALLRGEFSKARAGLGKRDGKVRRVLVSFGGSDPQNYTKLALDALDAASDKSLEVEVIAGAVNPHRQELAERCARRPRTRFYSEVSNIAEMFKDADLAIGAGGTTNWERSALGLPAIIISIADNQRSIVADLAEAGLIWGLPDLDPDDVGALVYILEAALRLCDVNRGMARRLQALVDGAGAGRVAGVLMQAEISVRKAASHDARDVFEWRNDPVVRAQSLDTRELSLEAHLDWFEKAIVSGDKILLIGELDRAGMGVVRFDLTGGEGRVSIYLNPAFRGKGLGPVLLDRAIRWLLVNRPDILTLVAEVKSENTPSHLLFAGAGFSPYYQCYVKALAP